MAWRFPLNGQITQRAFGVLLAYLMVAGFCCNAQEVSWVGTNGNWTSNDSWSSSTSPTAGSEVQVANGGMVGISTTVTSGSLTVGGLLSGTIELDGGSLAVSDLMVNEAGEFRFQSGALSVSDSLVSRGAFDFSDGSSFLSIGDNVTADFSQGTFIGFENLHFSGPSSATLLLPSDLVPSTDFASFDFEGNAFAVLGDKLIVPTNFTMDIRGDRPDRIRVLGDLRPDGSPTQLMNLTFDEGGVEVAEGGVFDMYNRTLNSSVDIEVLGGELKRVSNLFLNSTAREGVTFNQTGGSTAIVGDFALANPGFNQESKGLASISGGTLTTRDFRMSRGSWQSDTTWNQTGGAVTVTRDFFLSPIGSGTATLELSGGSLTVGDDLTSSKAETSLVVSGGDLKINDLLSVTNPDGRVTISDGSVDVGNQFVLGSTSGPNTQLTQSGGSLEAKAFTAHSGTRYTLTGGDINIEERFDLLGTLDFGEGSSANVTLAESAILDWSRGNIVGNPAALTYTAGPDSESYFPRGFNPFEEFASFESRGLIHSTGTRILIPITVNGRFTNINVSDLDIAGEITLEEGGTITANSVAISGGRLSGSGSIRTPMLANQGVLSPGDPVGEFTLSGDFVQSQEAVLEIALTQVGNRLESSRLTIDGVASLDGELQFLIDPTVEITDGFNQQLEFLTASNVQGQFASFSERISSDLVATIQYTPTSVIANLEFDRLLEELLGDFDADGNVSPSDADLLLTAIGSGVFDIGFDINNDGILSTEDADVWITDIAGTLRGDVNFDQQVDFADFLVLSTNFGTDGGWSDGNFTEDGSVSFADFLVLSTNFGQTTQAAAVPEPSGSLHSLLCVCALALTRIKRNRELRE